VIDRFGQEFRALAPPTGLFGTGALGNECLRDGLPTVVRALRQDFENSPPSTQQHEGFIHGDACEPSREPGLFLKVVGMKESLVNTLLHYIFGILPVIRYSLSVAPRQKPSIPGENQFLKCVRLSTLCGSHQRGV
jgi:hypothetical protein